VKAENVFLMVVLLNEIATCTSVG